MSNLAAARWLKASAIKSSNMYLRLTAFLLLSSLLLSARVTRIVIEETQSPLYDGKTFGSAGAYERLIGHAYGELDPANQLNSIITDIEHAPRNARGLVEYAATFTLLKPVDKTKMSPVMIYDVPNRGSHLMLAAFQGGDPGDGFFFERGYTILTSGWQGDVIPRRGAESLSVPIARNSDGSSITGQVLARFSDPPAGTNSVSLAGTMPRKPYEAASLDTSKAMLTKRASEDGEVLAISSHDWAFGDCRSTPRRRTSWRSTKGSSSGSWARW